MSLTLYTAPAVEPVGLDEMKAHLRVDHTSEDMYILGLIEAGRRKVESMSRHQLITQIWDWRMDAFPSSPIKLPLAPVISVTGIYYTLNGAAEVEYSSSNYSADIYSTPARIVLNTGSSWPSGTLEEVNGVKIRFAAGFGPAGDDVDPRLRQAVMLLAAHYYENREPVLVAQGYSVLPIPQTVEALVYEHRARAGLFE